MEYKSKWNRFDDIAIWILPPIASNLFSSIISFKALAGALQYSRDSLGASSFLAETKSTISFFFTAN